MNQDNFNSNNQLNELDSSNQNNNQEVLNVIPNGTSLNNENHQYDDAFIKTENNNSNQNNEIEEVNKYLNRQPNRFIQEDIDTTTNNLNSLNVGQESLSLPKIDYSKDPKVIENIKKKNTVTISSEGKVFLIIILVLLLFIFVLPTIFDYIRDIQYR